jgi:hypothetical protein
MEKLKEPSVKVKNPALKKLKALMAADPNLNGPEVLDKMWGSEVQKKIEQVGSGYENLKKRHARMEERNKNGAFRAHFSSDEEPEEEKLNLEEETKGRERASSGDYEKKRKKKTREDIEREALEKGDLYGVLGLEKLTYEAGDKDIRQAY